jgi:hypothetical protein
VKRTIGIAALATIAITVLFIRSVLRALEAFDQDVSI